jgi:hypothetical protein
VASRRTHQGLDYGAFEDLIGTMDATPKRKDAADPQLRQQLDALLKKTDDAYINNDPTAAALFTEDAVLFL